VVIICEAFSQNILILLVARTVLQISIIVSASRVVCNVVTVNIIIMGQSHSCTKSPLNDVMIHHEDDDDAVTSSGAEAAIITHVERRHKQEKHPKRRELMVAGLQVRQQRGESIAYLLKSLPYGSIVQLEVNTSLFVALPHRKLQLSIYQNTRGNIQLASIQLQEGMLPATLIQGQILVTINGKTVKTVDQAVQLLSMPEKLLLVVAEAPLDKKQRQQRKGTTARMVNCHLVQPTEPYKRKNALDMPPTLARSSSGTSNSTSGGTSSGTTPVPVQDQPKQKAKPKPTGPVPYHPDHHSPKMPTGTQHESSHTTTSPSSFQKKMLPLSSSPRTDVTMDTVNMTQYDDEETMLLQTPAIVSPSSSVSSALQAKFGDVSRIGIFEDEENDQPYVFASVSSDSQDEDDEASPKNVDSALNKLDSFLDDTMMELAYVMIEMEEFSTKQEGVLSNDQEHLETLEHDLRHKIFKILETKQRAVKEERPSLHLPTIEEQQPQVQHKLLQQQVSDLQSANAALKKELRQKETELQIYQLKEQQQHQVSKIRCQ
jgi:hypothetical protein